MKNQKSMRNESSGWDKNLPCIHRIIAEVQLNTQLTLPLFYTSQQDPIDNDHQRERATENK